MSVAVATISVAKIASTRELYIENNTQLFLCQPNQLKICLPGKECTTHKSDRVVRTISFDRPFYGWGKDGFVSFSIKDTRQLGQVINVQKKFEDSYSIARISFGVKWAGRQSKFTILANFNSSPPNIHFEEKDGEKFSESGFCVVGEWVAKPSHPSSLPPK